MDAPAELRSSSILVDPIPCPRCSSTLTLEASPARGFHVVPPRRCSACGNVWEPPAPIALLVVGVLATAPVGVGLVLGALFSDHGLLHGGRVNMKLATLLLAGGAFLLGIAAKCALRLVRRART